ncbi:hypothetical protein LINGRAHAP2_LOCUS13944 [Linum grandiflorum]
MAVERGRQGSSRVGHRDRALREAPGSLRDRGEEGETWGRESVGPR